MKQIIIIILLFATNIFAQNTIDWYIHWAPDVTAPSAPTSPSATGGNRQIVVAWTDPTNSDLDSIRIYDSADDITFTYLNRVAAGVETYTNTGLTDGQTVYYKLKAVDKFDNLSAYTSSVNATTDANVEYLAFKFGVSEDLKFLGATSIKLRFK